MIKFYKEAATDNWVCGVKRKIAAGTCTMETNADNSYIEIKENGVDRTIAEGPVSSFVNETGIAYASFAALDAATKDFFVKASEATYYDAVAEAMYSYGVLIDNNLSSPLVTRVGNLQLHKTLPIHSNMKGCLLLDNGTVNYYLNPANWTKKADGTASVLNGADGQVMVEIPEYWVMYRTIDAMKIEVRISERNLPGYTLKPKRYVSAYKASLQRSNNKLSSVINLTADFRGGDNNATNDANSKTYLGKPVTGKNLTDFRTYARNRAAGTRWNCMTYDVRKSLYWLFVIEYANLNSQAAVVGRNAITGYMDGGLGNGITNANETEWVNFNGYNPFVPCGASNALGNGSGEVNYVAADFGGAGVNRTFTIPRFRGVESPFGDIWEWTDGILIDVKTDASGGTSTLYTSNTPANFSSVNFAAYSNKGLLPRAYGWIKDIIFGTDSDILPLNVQGGGSNTYYCDYYWRNISWDGIRGVIFGGGAYDSSNAGLVYTNTSHAPSSVSTFFGSRLCFV